MASAMNRTLADLRDLNPTGRQKDIRKNWIDMRENMVMNGKILCPIWGLGLWTYCSSIEEKCSRFGLHYSTVHNIMQGFDRKKGYSTYQIQIEDPDHDVRSELERTFDMPRHPHDRMIQFDRTGDASLVYGFHHIFNNNKTYRITERVYYRTSGKPKKKGLNEPFGVPRYIFYRQEKIPPPWQWMLRNGTFLDDLNDDEKPLDKEAMELCLQWGIQRVQSNTMLLQVKWYHPFSLIKGFTKHVFGCEDLYILIAHFLCALQTKDCSYHFSKEKKEFESQWTPEDQEKNKRLRGELYDMIDGLVTFNEERPAKKRRLI